MFVAMSDLLIVMGGVVGVTVPTVASVSRTGDGLNQTVTAGRLIASASVLMKTVARRIIFVSARVMVRILAGLAGILTSALACERTAWRIAKSVN